MHRHCFSVLGKFRVACDCQQYYIVTVGQGRKLGLAMDVRGLDTFITGSDLGERGRTPVAVAYRHGHGNY